MATVTRSCAVCGIEWGHKAPCESPSCPCVGTLCGSAEMERAATRWRSRPSVAQSRTMTGHAALDHLERQAWLDMVEARGMVIDLEIEHR